MTKSISHTTPQQLETWLSGEMNAKESTAVESHLEECETCAIILNGLQDTIDPIVLRIRTALEFPTTHSQQNDFNLRIGAVAVQAGLISPQQLADSVVEWSSEPSGSISDLFIEKQWLTVSQANELISLVDSRTNAAATKISRQTFAAPKPGVKTSAIGDSLQLTRKHSSGAFGNIWIARDEVLGRDIAVKELRHEFMESPQVRRRFIREARAAAQLIHPGMVPVYGYYEDGNKCYYTMRFVEGDRLTEVIKKRFSASEDPFTKQPIRNVSLIDLLNYLLSVTDTIAYAHSHNVIHRDLKSENVVVGSFGEVVVLDWGLVKQLGGTAVEGAGGTVQINNPESAFSTAHGQRLGTPAFMSPEQARGDIAQIDQRTDVYSLGAILYEILCGQPPYPDENAMRVMSQVLNEIPTRPSEHSPNVPPELESICLTALSKNREDRQQSALEYGQQIRDWLSSRLE